MHATVDVFTYFSLLTMRSTSECANVCVCVRACVCVCLCWMCATIVWCVRVCVAFPNSVPPPSPPPITYTALRSRCSQHLRARYLLQIGLNSSAATAPTATATRLRSSCAPYAPPSRDHSLLACPSLSISLFLCVSSFSFLCHFVGFCFVPVLFCKISCECVFTWICTSQWNHSPAFLSLPCGAVLSLPPLANYNRKAGVKSETEKKTERENFNKRQ